MMPFGSLWLPVVVSAVAVWLASAVVWMVLPHHRNDFQGLSNEDDLRATLRKGTVRPGQYVVPHVADRKRMKEPDVQKRWTEGPNAILTVLPSGLPNLARQLTAYFAFCVVASFITAYIARHTMSHGTATATVFRMTATVAIAMYATARIPDAIFMGVPWGTTWRNVADGVAYGLITGAAFALLWPTA